MAMAISGVKPHSIQTPLYGSNPFDSPEDLSPGQRASSAPLVNKTKSRTSQFHSEGKIKVGDGDSSSFSASVAERKRYTAVSHCSREIENLSNEELEEYAVSTAEDTTQKVNECVKIAELMKEDATRTLITLHSQGEQIQGSHQMAADIDRDLSRGEKLLESLGGLFSRSWRPKITRSIRGPVLSNGTFFTKMSNHIEDKQKGRPEQCSPSNVMDKIEFEKTKQDSALSDLSNMLGQLKDMALDMGTEIDQHNKALERMQDDVDELNYRTKAANQRARHLLGKK